MGIKGELARLASQGAGIGERDLWRALIVALSRRERQVMDLAWGWVGSRFTARDVADALEISIYNACGLVKRLHDLGLLRRVIVAEPMAGLLWEYEAILGQENEPSDAE